MTTALSDAGAPDRSAEDSIADPRTYRTAVPHEVFARLRERGPVVRVGEPELTRHSAAGSITERGPGLWAVLGHEAVVDASRRTAEFSSAAKGAFLADPRTRADLQRARELLVNMDAPEHGRIRRVVTAVFTPRAVDSLAARVREHAHRLVDAAAAQGGCDAVPALAAELPLLVLADLLGIPHADRHLLFRWSNHLVGFDDPEYGGGDIDAYRGAMAEAFQYALGMALDRRRDPCDDLSSLLATAQVDGRRLSDREFCSFWLLLVVAGNETTRHLLSGSILALAQNPRVRLLLARDPGAIPSCVEELLRWITPIMQFRRTATADTVLAGQSIAEGDKVVLYYIAANRDPAVFNDPDRFDPARFHTVRTNAVYSDIVRSDTASADTVRPQGQHLAFGIGPHFCLGASLARLEARAMLEALRPHLDGLDTAGPPIRLESSFVNGLKSLPVRLGRG